MSTTAGKVIAVLIAAGAAAHAQRPIATTTRPITCDVAVLDPAGSPIPDLRAGDFEALVDGDPVTITRVSNTPVELAIILIVDATNSQPLKRYEISAAVANQWLPRLSPGDRVRIGVLASPLTMSAWLPADPRMSAGLVRPLIESAGAEPSPLWDATYLAIEALARESAPRMVVILSDGRSHANVRGLDDVADRALTFGVSVNVVSEGGERLLAQGADAAARIRPDASLEWLADQSGGVFVPDGVARRSLRPQQDPFAYVRELVQTPNNPGPLLTQVTSALRQRYRISFLTPADGLLHRLEVRVRRTGAAVHVKKRFLASR
jgi:hypothetical protein